MDNRLIGLPVRVQNLVTWRYDENGVRMPHLTPVHGQMYYFIGVYHSPLGTYVRSGGGYTYFGDDDFSPAYLKQTGTTKLARVVKSFRNKPVSVMYAEIEGQLLAGLQMEQRKK